MILLDIRKTQADRAALELLKQRVEGNYANFKAEMLTLDEEEIYDNAHRIAIVKDTYEQITGNGMDYMDEGEVEYLLKFYDPLEMVADYMEQNIDGEYSCDVDDAIAELLNDDNAHEKYITVNIAEKLMEKYGEDMPLPISLLQETIEAGERYVRLMKLTDLYDHDAFQEFEIPLKPYGSTLNFVEQPFFVYEYDDEFFIYDDEDDKEGCF